MVVTVFSASLALIVSRAPAATFGPRFRDGVDAALAVA